MSIVQPELPAPRTAPIGRTGAMLTENLRSAFRALSLNWLRSLLTMTGIVIGVLAIVSLVAIMKGVQAEVSKQVTGLGANLVFVVPGKSDESGQPNPMALMGVSPLTNKDVEALRRVPGVTQVSPIVFVSGTVEVKETKTENGKKVTTHRETSALVVATNKDGVVMNPTPLVEGRYFETEESDQNLCILGYKPKEDLFGKAEAVGRTVVIAGKAWKVIGVLSRPEGDGTLGNAMLGLSTLIYLPDKAVQRQIPRGQINRIAMKTDYEHPADTLDETLKQTLIQSHGGREDVTILTQRKAMALVTKLLDMATALLTLITAISLFVAGVGIMNIMLVTVTERTHEIGIRKTVGARRQDIFLQFLSEAIILSLLGGIIGLLLSWGLCAAIAAYTPLTPMITLDLILRALVVCTTVGIIFGVTPAVRAARLDPIEAMRHE